MCLPTAKSMQPAHILHLAFLTQPPQSPSPQEGLPLGANMDGTSNFTDMDTFGAGSSTFEFPNSSNPATSATNNHVQLKFPQDDIMQH